MNALALDFDGVLCDSVLELAISAWNASRSHINHSDIGDVNIPINLPPNDYLEHFLNIRPFLEFGYEAVTVAVDYQNSQLLTQDLLDTNDSKEAFREIQKRYQLDPKRLSLDLTRIRNIWLNKDLENWLKSSPLYDEVALTLSSWSCSQKRQIYIISTKPVELIRTILTANQVKIPSENIFGLESGPKEQTLEMLLTKHPRVDFVEDRIETLQRVHSHFIENPNMQKLNLLFALWGYSGETQKRAANKYNFIKQLTLSELLKSILSTDL